MYKRRTLLTLLAALIIVLGAVTPASAQWFLFSPFNGLAHQAAKAIAGIFRTDSTPSTTATKPAVENIDARFNDTNEVERVQRFLNALALVEAERRRGTLPVMLDARRLDARLDVLERRFNDDFIDLDEAMRAVPQPVAELPMIPVVVETRDLPQLQGTPWQEPENQLENFKEVPAGSNAFQRFLAGLKEDLKPETKTWVEKTTRSQREKQLRPPDIEIKASTGIKIYEDKWNDKQLGSWSWDSEKAPPSLADAYTSQHLNVGGDSALMNQKLATTANDQFKNVYMNAGNTKFGWTHIAYDRPDGTNHAREIKEHFNLPDQDASVRNFIIDTIKNGEANEQVRTVGGKEQSRMIYTRDVDGRQIKVVVDNDKYPGSVITAYPTGKVKIPAPEELKRRMEEEAKRKAAEAKKNVRWRSPTVYVDLYKNEKTLTLGPQLKGGASQTFRLGGAEIVNGAQGDLLLGTELTGATYAGIVDKTLSAGVRGGVFLGARARGEVSSAVQTGDLGLRGFVGGEVGAGASANGDAHVGIGMNGLEGRISGDAFVGVRAKGRVGGTVSYGDVKVTGAVNGTIGAGLGAHFDVTGKVGWSGVKAHVDVGAYLGIGGQLGFDINIDLGNKLDPVKKAVEKAYEGGKKVVKNVATGFKNAAKSIGKLFDW